MGLPSRLHLKDTVLDQDNKQQAHKEGDQDKQQTHEHDQDKQETQEELDHNKQQTQTVIDVEDTEEYYDTLALGRDFEAVRARRQVYILR